MLRDEVARIVYDNGCPDEECDRHETRTCKQCTEETADSILALMRKLVKKKKKYHSKYGNYMGVKALDDLLSELKQEEP